MVVMIAYYLGLVSLITRRSNDIQPKSTTTKK